MCPKLKCKGYWTFLITAIRNALCINAFPLPNQSHVLLDELGHLASTGVQLMGLTCWELGSFPHDKQSIQFNHMSVDLLGQKTTLASALGFYSPADMTRTYHKLKPRSMGQRNMQMILLTASHYLYTRARMLSIVATSGWSWPDVFSRSSNACLHKGTATSYRP